MMKFRLVIMPLATLLLTALLLLSGCEFDVAEPQWKTPAQQTETVTISGIEPAEATAGVNYITIRGNYLGGAIDTLFIHNAAIDTTYAYIYNGIYFNETHAEVVEASPTAIKVHRPNMASESCAVRIVSNRAFRAVTTEPYRVTPVSAAYGAFLDNVPLSVIAADGGENIYVVVTSSRSIVKVTAEGERITLATASRAPFDACIGPDGNLYLTGNNRAVEKVDVNSGAVTRWTQLPAGKVVKFGDFDQSGYFFSGGTRTDLVVVPFNLSSAAVSSGFYLSDDILAVRCFQGEVYVAVRAATEAVKIWKHAIGANGSLGAQELVLDLGAHAKVADRLPRSLAFSAAGILYIATDALSPLLQYDPATQILDYFYKSVLRPYCKHLCWGSKNHIYMICGNAAAGEEWLVYQVDMGTAGGI